MQSILFIIITMGALVGVFVVSELSRKLGEVLKIRAYWRLFIVAEVMLAAALAVGLLWPGQLIMALALAAAAITISVLCAFRYWSWALAEMLRGEK